VYEKRESQDICFVTDDSYTRFLESRGSAKTAGASWTGEGTSWATTRDPAVHGRPAQGARDRIEEPSSSWRSTRRGTRSSSAATGRRFPGGDGDRPVVRVRLSPGGRFRATARVRYATRAACAVKAAKDRLEVTFDTPQRSVTPAGPRPVRRDEVLGGAGSNARATLVVTVGCKANFADSAAILTHAASAGFEVVESGSPPTSWSSTAAPSPAGPTGIPGAGTPLRRTHPGAVLVMTGCFAETAPRPACRARGDHWLGIREPSALPRLLRSWPGTRLHRTRNCPMSRRPLLATAAYS